MCFFHAKLEICTCTKTQNKGTRRHQYIPWMTMYQCSHVLDMSGKNSIVMSPNKTASPIKQHPLLFSNEKQNILIYWTEIYTLKTGIPIEEGVFILKLLWRVSHPQIQLGVVFLFRTTTFIVNCNGIYFSSQEQIAYFLTQEAVYLLVHFKFLRVQI